MILQPKSDENSTLLSWLAYNTGTSDARDSCSAYNCPINYKYDKITKTCKRMITTTNGTTSDGHSVTTMDEIFYVTNTITNFCEGGIAAKDNYGNCCESGIVSNGICVPSDSYNAVLVQEVACDSSVNLNYAPTYYCADYTSTPSENPEYYTPHDKQMLLYCITTTAPSMDGDAQLNCDGGFLVLVDQYGNYIPADKDNYTLNSITNQPNLKPTMSYTNISNNASTTCTYTYTDSEWKWMDETNECDTQNVGAPVPKTNQFLIQY